ncbi:hypothetical protein [Bacteroides congonensis]
MEKKFETAINANEDFNVIIGEQPIPNNWNLDSYKQREKWEERKREIEEKNKKNELDENCYRYRCHQTVLNRIDGTITSNADTKRELEVKVLREGNNTIVNTQIVESNIDIRPENMRAALQLINEVDIIKCNAHLILDPETGKIARTLNLSEIKKNWEEYKKGLYHKLHATIRTKREDLEHLDNFVHLIDNNFATQESFIADLTSKLFFDVFFDKYLVGKKVENEIVGRTFYSMLFNQMPIKVAISQTAAIDKDSKLFTISNYITNENQRRKDYDANFVRKMYEQYYQPIVKYDFTYYNLNFDSKIVIGTDNLPDEINVNLVEEIENNVEILVVYKIRRLK